MNTPTTAAAYTPLETLLLFRGIAQHGVDAAAFAQISDLLRNNDLVKHAPTFDARRLRPEPLQELFLHLLWEELKVDNESLSRADSDLSSTPKKRRLQPPPPTLRDARRHVDKIEAAYVKLQDAYLDYAIQEIQQLEHRYDVVQAEIDSLEKARSREVDGASRPKGPNGAQEAGALGRDTALVNGTGPVKTPPKAANPAPPPSLQAHQTIQQQQQQQQQQQEQQQQLPQPQPHPHQQPPPSSQQQPQHPSQPQAAQAPHPQPQSLRPLQPLLPHIAPAPRQEARNGPSVSVPQGGSDKPGSAPASPALVYPQVPRSSQNGHWPQAGRPLEPPKAPNGTPQVLQAPQGVPSFQPPQTSPAPAAIVDGLQRPDGVARPKQTPVPPPSVPQLPGQSQFKWEPPYQPGGRPMGVPQPPHQINTNVLPSPAHTLPAQRSPHRTHPPPHSGPPSQPQAPSQPGRPISQPGLNAPQNAGQFAPSLQPVPPRHVPEPMAGPGPNRQQPSTSSLSQTNAPQAPFHAPAHPGYPQQTPVPPPLHAVHTPQPQGAPAHPSAARGPAAAVNAAVPAPVPPPRPGHGLAAPRQRPPQLHSLQAPPQYPQPTSQPAATSPSSAQSDIPRGYNSPYHQPPRPGAPERYHPRPTGSATPARISPATSVPHTPALSVPSRLAIGSGTKWVSTSTPSTPKQGFEFRLGHDDIPSPAIEPLSPVQQHAPLPRSVPREETNKAQPLPVPDPPVETPGPKRKTGRPRPGQQQITNAVSPAPSLAVPSQTPKLETPEPEEGSEPATAEPELPRVKREVTTPRPDMEAGDTTADESVAGGRRRAPRVAKRKRDDLTPTPVQTPVDIEMPDLDAPGIMDKPPAPNQVLWTRSFNKVSGSAIEQIIHHRSANMFAAPIREKDAPGYHKVILQPQDLKSIRAAINHGNKAGAQAAAALPGGDPGTSSVWLPISEELVPLKGIINSGQLDRELAHMFANAVMYNPDPGHGPGPAFLRRSDDNTETDGGEDVLGYKVDEFGVVNETRAMFAEVDKLLSELRSAELERGAPGQGVAGTGTSTRQASVAAHQEKETLVKDEGEEGSGTEAEGGTAKRRRLGRG